MSIRWADVPVTIETMRDLIIAMNESGRRLAAGVQGDSVTNIVQNITTRGGGGRGSTGYAAWYGITYAATVTPDYLNGPNQKVTLTGSITINFPTNAVDGQPFRLLLIQDATGYRTITVTALGIPDARIASQPPSTYLLICGVFDGTTKLRITSITQGLSA